jgi:hypothetical protein
MTKNITKIDGLIRFENDGIEIFIDPQGKSFASISGVARMADKHLRTIQNFIDRTAIPVITTEIDTGYGKKLHVMLSSGSICKVLAQYNKDRLIQFAEVGVETALHQIAGYQQEQHDRPNLNTFTIYDLKPWQIERLVAAIEYRKEDESIPAAYFEDMEGFDESIWEIPFDVINWLQSLHQDLIEEFVYRKCLESNNLADNKVLQDYVRRFEADAVIRDDAQVREMAELIVPHENLRLVQKELAIPKGEKPKPLGFGKSKK